MSSWCLPGVFQWPTVRSKKLSSLVKKSTSPYQIRRTVLTQSIEIAKSPVLLHIAFTSPCQIRRTVLTQSVEISKSTILSVRS